MRNRFIISSSMFLLALASASVASAQVGGGIKGGVNFANVSGFNDVSTSQREGIVLGGFVTIGFAPALAFQPEVLFSMQGSKLHFDTSGTVISSDVTAKLDYIQIPLLLRVGGKGKSPAGLYGIVGPSLGVLAHKENVSDYQVKDFDAGIVGGAGVNLSVLLLEARATFGLTDLNSGGTNTSYKNRVFSVLIGLQF